MENNFISIATAVAFLLQVNPFNGLLAQSSDQNYIRTRTMLTNDGSAYLETIQYFDGLGRPSEMVQKGITPGKADLVTLQEYDAYGRESHTWLPTPVTGNNGAYKDPTALKTLSKATAAYNDTKPYSLPVYESSPLNRIQEQYGPGADWQDKGKAVKTEYLTNTATSPFALRPFLYGWG